MSTPTEHDFDAAIDHVIMWAIPGHNGEQRSAALEDALRDGSIIREWAMVTTEWEAVDYVAGYIRAGDDDLAWAAASALRARLDWLAYDCDNCAA